MTPSLPMNTLHPSKDQSAPFPAEFLFQGTGWKKLILYWHSWMNSVSQTLETRKNWLLDGKVELVQPVSGYRAGMDAVLLASAVRAKPGERLLDVGSGAGGALLCAAQRLQGCQFVGLEKDPLMVQLALANIASNHLQERVSVMLGEVGRRSEDLLNAFDHVFSNPPFFKPEAIQDVHPDRQNAYLAYTSLEDWLKFMLHAVRPKGRITLIHRAGEVARILGWLNTRFGEIKLMPIYSRPNEAAKRILVTARKGLREGDATVSKGLVLHSMERGKTSERDWSPRMNALMSGEALDWE